eukprot:1376728-Amorphochlora_amoeboformis.AAC.1
MGVEVKHIANSHFHHMLVQKKSYQARLDGGRGKFKALPEVAKDLRPFHDIVRNGTIMGTVTTSKG